MITKQASQTLINSIVAWCPIFEKIPGVIIAGGFIRSFYKGETPKDMDLYFESPEAFEAAKQIFDKPDNHYKLAAETEFALSYNDERSKSVQLIRFVFGKSEKIISVFDFTVCCATFRPLQIIGEDGPGGLAGEIYLHDDFFEHLAAGILVFTGSKMPLSSLKRAFKFVKRGYHICDENIIALAESVGRSIDFDRQESVEQQIAGMDPEGGRRIRVID